MRERMMELIKNKKVIVATGLFLIILLIVVLSITLNSKAGTTKTASAGQISKVEQVGVKHYKEEQEKYTKEDTNIYVDCTDKANSLGFVAKGTKIIVTGITGNDWYEVEYMGSVGYMKKDVFVEENETTVLETVDEKETTTEAETTTEETTTEAPTQENETVPTTEIVEYVPETEAPTEAPTPQYVPEPVTEAPTQAPQPQPTPQSCELPDVANMIYSSMDSHHCSNTILEAGVYDACLGVVNQWINGSISRENAIGQIMSNPLITEDSDGNWGNDILAFECAKLTKNGKGCSYEEYAQLSYNSILSGINWLSSNAFLYVYAYYDGNTDTTNIYVAMGSATGR